MELSVCIPVYNFGQFIDETIESIFLQLMQVQIEYEVLVFDGGSTDDTPMRMQKFCREYRGLRYVRQNFKGGIDADLHSAVLAARGRYCFLLSGDDRLRVGAVQSIIKHMNSQFDIYLCRHTNCDVSLNYLGEYPIFKKESPIDLDFSNNVLRLQYLQNALNSEAIFSFMSGLLIRRSTWISATVDAKYFGTCWSHVARFFQLSKNSLSLRYTSEAWIDKRGGNDSFARAGMVKRIAIAVDQLSMIASDFFGVNSHEHREIERLICNDVSGMYWLNAKARVHENPSLEDAEEFLRLAKKNYKNATGSKRIEGYIVQYVPAAWLYYARKMILSSRKL